MNRNPDNDPDNDPDQDPKNDAAWDLLLKAHRPEVSPFFARNVLREIRLMGDRQSSGWRSLFSLSLPRLLTGTATAAIIMAVIVVSDRNASAPNAPIAQVPEPVETVAPTTTPRPAADAPESFGMGDYEDEIEMIDYLDGLLAIQDVSALDDEALSELLF